MKKNIRVNYFKILTFAFIAFLSIGREAKAQYCAASGESCTSAAKAPIEFVKLSGDNGGITNYTLCESLGYGDYTSLVSTMVAGSAYTLNVTCNRRAYVAGQISIWVDWNNNGVFTDLGENVLTSSTGSSPSFSGAITPPNGTSLGNKRMRIRTASAVPPLSSCGYVANGEVEDYTIKVTATPSTTPKNPNAAYCVAYGDTCNSANVSPITNVTIAGSNGGINNTTNCEAGGYGNYMSLSSDLHLGSSYNFTVAANASGYFQGMAGMWIDWNNDNDFNDTLETIATGSTAVSNFTGTITVPLGATLGTKVLRIRTTSGLSADPCGYQGIGEVEDYTVNILSATYCSASGSGCTSPDHPIVSVVIAGLTTGINNATGCETGGYGDYTAQKADMQVGGTYNFTIKNGTGTTPNYPISIWVDWNNDYDFSDAGEAVSTGNGTALTGVITPPPGTTLGNKRVRIKTNRFSSVGTNPDLQPQACGYQVGGEVEDYTINVVDPTICSTLITQTFKGPGARWGDKNNWTPAGVPTKCTNAVIPNTFNVVMDTVSLCNNLTINNGASLAFQSSTFNIYGNLQVDAGGVLAQTSGHPVILNGKSNTVSGKGNISATKIAVNGGADYTIQNDIAVNKLHISANGDIIDLAIPPVTASGFGTLRILTDTLTVADTLEQKGHFFQGAGVLQVKKYDALMTDSTFFEQTGTTYFNAINGTPPVNVLGDPYVSYVPGIAYNNLKVRAYTGVSVELAFSVMSTGANLPFTCNNFDVFGDTTNVGNNFDITAKGHFSIGSKLNFRPFGNEGQVDKPINVAGDWINNGTFDNANPANQTVTFNGTAAQTISGTGRSRFFNLTINNTNTAGITLAQDILVGTGRNADGTSNPPPATLTMIAGNVNLNGYTINLDSVATVVGETNNNRIYGTTGKITAFGRTPGGNIAGLGATITSPTSSSLDVTRNHTVQNVNGQISVLRDFDIRSKVNTALNATFQFAYFNKERNGRDKNKLTLFHSGDNGATWNVIDCSQTNTIRDTIQNTVQQAGIATLTGRWTVAESGKVSGTAVKDTSICSGGAAMLKLVNNLASTIKWQSSVNGSSAWADVPGATSQSVTVSPVATRFYRAVVSTSTCSDTSNNVKVTVLPTAVAGTAKSDKTLCSGSATTVTLTGNTGTIQWQDSTASGTWKNITGATTANYNTPVLNQTTYYRAKVTIGSCPAISNTVTITINPSVMAGTAGRDTVICNGNTVVLNVNGSTGNIQWQDSSKTSAGVWNNISGATTASFTTASLTDTTFYRVMVSNANSTCFDISNKVKVSVVPLEVPGTAGSDATICSGNSTHFTLTGSTGNIQWQDSTSGGTWANIAGATMAAYNTQLLNTTTYYRAKVFFSTCNSYSNIVTITVNPAASAGTASPDMLLCTGNATTIKLTGSSGTIQWQDSSKTMPGVWTNIAGATNANYTTPALTDTVYYRAVLQNGTATCFDTSRVIAINIISGIMVGMAGNDSSICSGNSAILRLTNSLGNIQWQDSSAATAGTWMDIIGATTKKYTTAGLNDTTYFRAKVFAGTGCSDTSNVFKILVYPTPVGGTAGPDASVCINTGTTITLTGYTGNIQWQDSTTATAGVWMNIPGETNPILNTGSLNDTTYFRAMLTNVATLSCSSTSNTVKVTVSPKPVAGTASNDTSVCYSSSVTVKLAGSFGNVQWQDSTRTGGIWMNITSAKDSIYTTPSLTDTTYYRAVLSTSGCSNDTSTVIAVAVRPQAIAGTISNDTTICAGGTATITLTGSAGTIQWQTSADNITYTDSTGAINNTLLAMQAGGVRYYKAVVNNYGCLANSLPEKVTVTPVSLAGTISNDTTICYGNPAYIHLKNYRGTIQWQTSTDGTTFVNSAGETEDSLQVDVTTTEFYRAVVTNGVCSSTISAIQKTTVAPIAMSGTVNSSQSICKGSSATLRLTGNVGSAQWQVSANTTSFVDSTGATADTLVVSPQGRRYYRVVVTSGSCSSDISNPVIIDVDTPPVAGTVASDQTICKGSTAKLYVSGSSGNIQWQTSDDNLNFADSTGATTDTIFAKPQNTRYYRALAKNGACTPAASNSVTITVNPTSVAGTITGTDTICKGSSKTIVLKNSVGNKQWQVSNDGIAFSDTTGATIDSITVSPAATRYYRAYAKSGLCSADTSLPVKITVFSPNIAGIAAKASDVCAGSSTQLTLTGYNGNIQWQKSLDSIAWTNIVPGSATPLTIAPTVNTFYRAILSDGGVCSADTSNRIKVNVVPPAIADSVVADNAQTCVGNSTRIRLVGNTGKVQWQSSPDAGTFTDIPGATATSYYTSALTDTIYYRAVVKNGICYDTSKVVKVSVRPAVQMVTITGTDSVCVGSNATLNIKMLKDNVLKWLQSTDNFSYTDVPSSNNDSTITPAPGVTTYYKVILTNTTCNDTSAAFKVIVTPLSVAGSAMSSGTHCTGTVTTLSINGYVGKLQWQSSTNGTTYGNVTNATLPTLNVSPTVTTYYKVYVKSGKCSSVYSNIIKLTVVQGSVAGTATAAKSTVCIGSPANITLAGYIGAIQWQRSNSAADPFVNIAVNSTQPTYRGAVTAATYYRALVRNASCDSVVSNTVFITTVPGVNAGVVKATRDTICVGDSANLKLSFSKGPIQWQVSFTTTNWQNINGATDSSYVSAALTSTVYYRAVLNNNSCSDTTAVYKIIVNTPPVAGSIISSQNLCLGENATITLNNYSGNIQWQASRDANFVSLRNEVLSTVVVTPYITTFYRARVTTPGCKNEAYTNVDTVKVLPLSVPGFVNIDRTVRPGVSALVTIKSYVGNIQWQSSLDSITFKDVAGENGATLETNPKRNTYYRAVVSSASCVSVTNIVKVTVDFAIYSISPVPSKDNITVSFNLPENQLITVKVYDMLGKVVMEQPVNGVQGYNELKIDIAGYSSGMHYLQIENESTLIKGKFIKE